MNHPIDRSRDAEYVQILPSPRQLALQETEFYAFVHFTVNAFTDREWGDGTESPSIFNPTRMDARQWVRAVKAAGMRGLILTCKHHDGFCLWPSRYTEHSVRNAPYKNGQGDLVREVSDACAEAGIRFGVYLSPWDRNSAVYGQGKAYDDYFVHQLTELLTNYGPIFAVWFDGACGEGSNGKKQTYDWARYYKVVRTLQPGACINICGPDIRWCGNEAGHARTAERCVLPAELFSNEEIAARSQQTDDPSFREQPQADDNDLGSRARLAYAKTMRWYPAEVDTSIRPGWFYHASEDDKVRTLDDLLNVYLGSVGGNASLILNIPPTPEGLFHENDVRRLEEIGETLRGWFAENLLNRADTRMEAPDAQPGFGIENAREENYDACFKTPDGVWHTEITASWDTPVSIRHLILKEDLRYGERIESFAVDALQNGEWVEQASGLTVGHKRIVTLDTAATALRIRITDSRVAPTLSFIGIYA